MAARSATDHGVNLVRAGLVADRAVSIEGLGGAVSQGRVGLHLSRRKWIGLEVCKQHLELGGKECVLPAKRLLRLQREGQNVCRLSGVFPSPTQQKRALNNTSSGESEAR